MAGGPQAERVAVVTPWFPGPRKPFAGSFVQAMVEATGPGTVFHCEERVTGRPAADASPERADTGGTTLVRVPVELPLGLSYAEIARRHEAALRGALDGAPIDAPVVHAHVGLPGGWAALRNAAPTARVLVTEHASFLRLILAQDEARAMYDELLHECAGLFAVGAAVRDPLLDAFPHHKDKIGVLPNPVSFAATRPHPVTELRRWLYVGALVPAKGVHELVEAFARCHADDPALTLTLIGDGDQRQTLDGRAAELGVAGAVTFLGSLPHAEALTRMREHDLLVHPSHRETFGMTVVEAVAAGLPVLVTRCGGPEETLGGAAVGAGELIPVQKNGDALVAGFRRLRKRFPDGLDLTGARRALEARYGYPAVAAAHRRVWFPAEETQ